MNDPAHFAALADLEHMSAGERAAWFAGLRLDSPGRWWPYFFDSSETRLSPLMAQPRDEVVHRLQVLAEAVDAADAWPEVSKARIGYWVVRLAFQPLRYEPPLDAVPEVLTPDGAVRWFLDRLPFTPEEAVAEDRRLREFEDELERIEREADDPDYVGPSASPERVVLVDVMSTLDFVARLRPSIRDRALLPRVDVWLAANVQLWAP